MKKLWMIGLTAVVLSFFGMAPATAATLCVEPTGAMGCYTSVSAAVAAAGAGDKIWVAPGVYYENVIVTTDDLTIQGGTYTASGAARRRGRAALPTWAPVDPTQVIIDARPNPDCSGSGEAFWIDGANHVTIANLTVRHSASDNIYSTGNYTTLDTLRVLSADDDGADIEGNFAVVRKCYFSGNLDDAVDIVGNYAVVQNNTMYNHGEGGIEIYGQPIGPNDPPSALLVSGNQLDGVEDGDAIYVDSADNAVVTYNVIRGAATSGVYIYESHRCTVSENDIRSISNSYGGIYIDGCDYTLVIRNYLSGIYGYGIYVYYYSEGNNVIRDNTVEDLYGSGIYVYGYDTTITGNVVRNVNYYYGIYVDYADGGTITNNLVEGTTGSYAGFYLYLDDVTVSNNTAQFNGGEGFEIEAYDCIISNNKARHNGNYWEGGFWIYGSRNAISGNLAEMNPGYGFYIYGGNTVSGNTANNNYRTGIYLRATDGGNLLVNANVATNNHGEGIANFASGTCSITNNTALGNRTDICDEGPADFFQNNTFATGGWNVPCCLEAAP